MARRRRELRKTSGSDKYVDFRRAPRGDWDADQSGGHRVTIMLPWIIREFLRVWWPTRRISHGQLVDRVRLLLAICPVNIFQLGKYSLPRYFIL